MRRDVYAFKYNVVNMYLPVCTSELFTVKLHLLDHMIYKILRFENLSTVDSLLFKHFNTSFKAAYRHTFERCPTRLDKKMFGPYKI